MTKKFIIPICLLVCISLIFGSCKKEKESDEDPWGDMDISTEVAPLYESSGEESPYGFIYDDYVYKKEVYLAPWYSRSFLDENENLDGMVYHFQKSELLEYKEVSLDLAEYFSKETSFQYNNYFDYETITNTIVVTEYHNIDISNIPVVKKESLLLVDEDKNLYLGNGDYFEVQNRFSFDSIYLLERVSHRLISAISLDDSLPEVGYDSFISSLELFKKTKFNNISDFLDASLFGSPVWYTSGIFYEIYKISKNFVMTIYKNPYNEEIQLCLMALENGVVVEKTCIVEEFERLLYSYDSNLLLNVETKDILEYSTSDSYLIYSFNSLASVDYGYVEYFTTSYSSVLDRYILETQKERDELKEKLEGMLFFEETRSEFISIISSMKPYAYIVTYGDITLVFYTTTNNLCYIESNGLVFRVIGSLDEFYQYCSSKVYLTCNLHRVLNAYVNEIKEKDQANYEKNWQQYHNLLVAVQVWDANNDFDELSLKEELEAFLEGRIDLTAFQKEVVMDYIALIDE